MKKFPLLVAMVVVLTLAGAAGYRYGNFKWDQLGIPAQVAQLKSIFTKPNRPAKVAVSFPNSDPAPRQTPSVVPAQPVPVVPSSSVSDPHEVAPNNTVSNPVDTPITAPNAGLETNLEPGDNFSPENSVAPDPRVPAAVTPAPKTFPENPTLQIDLRNIVDEEVPKPTLDELREQALTAFRAQNFAQATELAEKIAEQDASDVQFFGKFLHAMIVRLNEPQRAVALAQILTVQNPASKFAWNYLGWAHIANQDVANARLALDRAIEYDDNTMAEINLNYADVYLAEGNLERAAAEYRHAISIDGVQGAIGQIAVQRLQKMGMAE